MQHRFVEIINNPYMSRDTLLDLEAPPHAFTAVLCNDVGVKICVKLSYM